MGFKLGDISPLAAAVTGEGFATNFGLLPAMRARQVEKEKAAEEAIARTNAAKEEEKIKQEQELAAYRKQNGLKKGGKVSSNSSRSFKKSSKASSASSRADGIAQRGKTRGRMI